MEASKYEQLFGSPQGALELYATHDGRKDKDPVEYAHVTLPRKHLTGTSLAFIIDKYTLILSRNLHDKMFQVGFWTLIEDFWSFFQQVITRCIMEALFGSAILKVYPTLIKDYWKYDDAVVGFMPSLPHILTTTAHEGPRNRLHQGIRMWLSMNESDSEPAEDEGEKAEWDEYRGSKFIQERDRVFATMEGIDTKTRIAETLSVMY